MRIGTILDFTSVNEMEKKICAMLENGFDSCQLGLGTPDLWTDENAIFLKELLDKYGITVSAAWCVSWEGPGEWNFYDGQLTIGLVPVEYRQMRIQRLCAGADFAHKLGITDVITHMGFIPENPNDPNFNSFCAAVRLLARHLEKNGQYLLFETGQETPVTMLRSFEKIDCENLGINLDTANLILYGKANPVDALDVFGRYVRNIHAKDGRYPVNGHDLGEETRIGEGKVDFRALFKKLRELGYDTYITIEREIEGDQQLIDILESRDYLQKIIEEVYGG